MNADVSIAAIISAALTHAPGAVAVCAVTAALVLFGAFEVLACARRLTMLRQSRSATAPREAPARRTAIFAWAIVGIYSSLLFYSAFYGVLFHVHRALTR